MELSRKPAKAQLDRIRRALTWEAWLLLVVIAAYVVFVLTVQGFTHPTVVHNVSRAFTILGILAVGQSLVMAAGGIDLSVGSIFGLAGILVAILSGSGYGFEATLFAGLGAGCLIGLLNGLIVTKLGFKPFIATFAMLAVVRAVTYLLMKGTVGLEAQAVRSETWTSLARGATVLWFYPSFFILLGLAVFAWILLKHTRFGLWAHGTGGSLDAARAMGVPVDKVRIITYVVSGAAAAMAGMLSVGALQGVRTFDGAGLELTALAAVIIGGASLAGGTSSILGTLLAVVLIVTVQIGVSQMGLAPHYQSIVTGLVLLVALVLTRLSLRKDIAVKETTQFVGDGAG